MGTDIHLRLQRKTADGWEDLPVRRPNWSRPDAKGLPDPEERRYNLFGFLANVRNGSGFTGCKLGDPVPPQFAGRGLPDGVTPESDVPYEWLGEHSFTWATVAELKAAPWDMEFRSCGYVPDRVFKTWRERGGAPDNYCGDIVGDGIVKIAAAEYDAVRHTLAAVPEDKVHVHVWWTHRPLVTCGFKRWLDTLDQATLGVSSLDDARVVMGFDS